MPAELNRHLPGAAQAIELLQGHSLATLAQLARRSQSRTRSGLAAPMQALADARQANAAWQQHLAAQTSTLLAQTALMRALAVPAPL